MKISRLRSVFIVIMSFFLFSFGGTKHKNDLQRNNLKGRVKATTELWYPVNMKSRKIDTLPEKTIDTYDSIGNLLSSIIYQQDGKIFCGSSFTYDKPKRLIIEKYFDGESTRFRIIKYDNNLNWVIQDGYSKNKILEDILVRKYDSLGNEIEEMDFFETIHVVGMYDSAGKVVGQSESDSLHKDSIVGMQDVDSSWECSKWVYKYDFLGNRIEEDSYLNDTNKLSYKTINKYDDKNNQIQVCGYEEPSGKLHGRYICKYANYDKEGNWTKKVRLHNNVVEGITKRTIEYYQ